MKNTVIGKFLAVIVGVALLFSVAPLTNVSAAAVIAIGPESGTVGTRVSVQGQNFEQDTSYDIYFSSQDTNISTPRHISIDIGRFKKVLTASTTFFPSFNAVFDVPDKLDTATGGQYEITHDGDYYVYVTEAGRTLILAKAVFRMTGFAQVVVDPASGNVGGGVIITGTGYVPGETVAIAWDNRDVTNTHVGGTNVVNEAGKFVLTFTIPDSVYGLHHIRVIGSYSETIVKEYTVLPEIRLNKTTAQSGDQVSITGSGFGASRNVIFSLGGEIVNVEWVLEESERTDETGRFVVNMVVPDVVPGEYMLVATDASSGVASAEKSFTVEAPPLNRQLELGLVNGRAGDTMIVSGKEFLPNRTIMLTIDGIVEKALSPITTDEDGSFIGSFEIPLLPHGLHVVEASDGVGSSTAIFSVTRVLEITPLEGKAGTIVTVTGTGLEAGIAVLVYFDDAFVVTDPSGVHAGEDGTVNFTFAIPACPPGNHVIKVRTDTFTVTETFITAAKVTVDPDVTMVGRVVTISANGFAPNSPLVLSLNGIKVEGIDTGAYGAVDIIYTVPHVPDGTYALKIEAGGVVIAKDITLVANASFSITKGAVGDIVEVSGSGFWPGKIIDVKWDGEVLSGTVVVDSEGAFKVIFKVPPAVAGGHVLTVSDGVITKEETFNVEKTAPAAPALLEPADKTKVGGGSAFKWGPVTYPIMDITYDLQILRGTEVGELVLEKTGLEDANYKLTSDDKLDKAGKDDPYYWRVRAVDEVGNASPWSEVSEFYYGFIWPMWATWVLVGLAVVIIAVVVYIFRWRILDLF